MIWSVRIAGRYSIRKCRLGHQRRRTTSSPASADVSTAGASAYLRLTCYFYPSAACTAATCQLDVGFISSTTGGAAWSTPTQLAEPMTLSWLASTNQGPMVGDYIATSILAGEAWGLFAWRAPSGGLFDEAMFVPTGGLPLTGSGIAAADPW